MGNIIRVSSLDTNLNDNPKNLMPPKKTMERTKEDEKEIFSDIYEIRRLSTDFNKASLESKKESLAYIRTQMQNIVQNIRLSGTFVIRDISYNQQLQTRALIEN